MITTNINSNNTTNATFSNIIDKIVIIYFAHIPENDYLCES